MTESLQFETVGFASEDGASGFHSGVAPLDEFFRTQAGQNQKKNISRTWVLRRSDTELAAPLILGFYTLTLASVERETLPAAFAKKLPRYPVPVVLLGRLAVDERVRGQRVGERLLLDAHARSLAISAHAGAVGIVVDAKDQAAATFYARYGYAWIERDPGAASSWPQRMFIALKTLQAAAE